MTLLLVAAVSITRSAWTPLPAEEIGGIAAPLGSYLVRLQLLAPVWSRLLALAVTVVCGVQVGRLTVRYGLYAAPTSLAVPFYGLVATGIYVACDTLAAAVASWLLVRSLANFCAAFRNGYTFNATFRASLYLGLLPLFSAVALPLAALILPALFCFRRTFREAVVALFGLLLPTAALCYLGWAFGGTFLAPVRGMWDAFQTPSGFGLLDDMPLFRLLFAGLLLVATLSGVFCFLFCFKGMGMRQRAVLCYALFALPLCAALAVAPGATPSVLPLAAVPVSVFMPLLFVRIRKTCSSLLYAALFVLFALGQFAV